MNRTKSNASKSTQTGAFILPNVHISVKIISFHQKKVQKSDSDEKYPVFPHGITIENRTISPILIVMTRVIHAFLNFVNEIC